LETNELELSVGAVRLAGKQQMRTSRCHNVITMKIRAASLVELHAFLGVCNTGSMRQAAEQLCVTQAAVSRAVARLERRVGCTLFERSAQGVSPTAAARALQARIEPSLVELERAFTEFIESPAQRSTLRLSVVPTFGTRWLMPRLAAFQAAHPGIAVELRQFHHNEDFRRDDIDVWIYLKRPATRWPRGISARYLIGREITPVCTPKIAARLKGPADLLNESLLHHTNFPDNWRLWLSTAGASTTRLKLGGGFDLAHNLIVAAAAGMGVAVIQPCLIERELASGELVLPFDLSVSTGRGYFFCTRKAADGKNAIEVFRRWIGETVRQGD
jgi:LysR family glycine cleavage system transcriptional activator